MKRVLAALLLACGTAFALGAPEVRLQMVSTNRPSSFRPLLWVRVKNQTYTPLNLADLINASELVIDGKAAPRIEGAEFNGPEGVGAAGEWSGCVPLTDYVRNLPPGKHTVSFQVGGARSKEETLRWSEPVHWQAGTMKTRLNEIHEAADALPVGLPRACVELWFTDTDGGPQEATATRYFLEPQFKMLVPYSKTPLRGPEDDLVSGAPKIFQEPRLAD